MIEPVQKLIEQGLELAGAMPAYYGWYSSTVSATIWPASGTEVQELCFHRNSRYGWIVLELSQNHIIQNYIKIYAWKEWHTLDLADPEFLTNMADLITQQFDEQVKKTQTKYG